MQNVNNVYETNHFVVVLLYSKTWMSDYVPFYSFFRRYMKKGGPGQMTFIEDDQLVEGRLQKPNADNLFMTRQKLLKKIANMLYNIKIERAL